MAGHRWLTPEKTGTGERKGKQLHPVPGSQSMGNSPWLLWDFLLWEHPRRPLPLQRMPFSEYLFGLLHVSTSQRGRNDLVMQVLAAVMVAHFAESKCVSVHAPMGPGDQHTIGHLQKGNRLSCRGAALDSENSPCAFLSLLALVFLCTRLNS